MEKNKRRISIKFHIIAIISIVIFCFAISPKTLQNDTYYTIRIGELILNNGIDMQDHFSWHENLPYTYPHWAYDVGTYLVFHLGEMTGIHDGGMLFIYLMTAILSCVLGLLIYFINNKLTNNKLVSFFVTMFAMYMMIDFIAARAQLVTFILFILTILCIESFLKTNKKVFLLAIILISIAIANIHVAVWPFFFVLFMPYIVEYIIAAIAEKNLIARYNLINTKMEVRNLQKRIAKEKKAQKLEVLNKKLEEQTKKLAYFEIEFEKIKVKSVELRNNPYKIKVRKNKAVRWLVLVLIICAFTGLLTPLKDTPYTYLYKTMQGNTTQSISEHLPLTLYNEKETMIVLALFLMMLIFTDVKIKLSDLFMLAGLVYLSFMSRRQVSLLIIVGGFIFAKLLTYLVEKYDKEGCEKYIEFLTTIIGMICTFGVVLILALGFIKVKLDDKYINSSSYPVEAVEWILDNLDVQNMRLFNEYNYGSYLLYKGIPVFIDSRADLYSPEFNGSKNENGEFKGRDIFSDYINTSTIGLYYENTMKDYDITHVILYRNSKLNMFISRDDKYKELYSDDHFVIYERLDN